MTKEQTKRYILTEDIYTIFSNINKKNSITEAPLIKKAIKEYTETVKNILKKELGNQVVVEILTKDVIESEIFNSIDTILKNDPNTICLCLDKFLLKKIELSSQTKYQFFRFQIGRTHKNIKVPRHNTPSFSVQTQQLCAQIKKISANKLIIVDIGVFSGKTMHKFLTILAQNNIQTPISHIITYICAHKYESKFRNIQLSAHLRFKNLYEWVDLHDFSPLGGKILSKNKVNKNPEAVPYIFPWSDGRGASLHLEPEFLTISKKLIIAFKKLVDYHDLHSNNNPLTFSHIVNGGFTIPNNPKRTLLYKKNTLLTNYLETCLKLIIKEQEKKVLIFDMDGTLYNFKKSKSFENSELNNFIKKNALIFIQQIGKCNLNTAKSIMKIGLRNQIGLSAYISNKYGISRKQYFDIVWNINPKNIIRKSIGYKNLLKNKKKAGYKLILISSAPHIWVTRVLRLLGVYTYFDDIYSAEDYSKKDDIFKLLAQRYNPKNCTSIGDQLETDILPAKKYGMKTWHIKKSDGLKKWKSILS